MFVGCSLENPHETSLAHLEDRGVQRACYIH